MIRDLCQNLSDIEISNIATRFQNEDGKLVIDIYFGILWILYSVNYEACMQPLACNRPVYRDGNNLTEILSHRNVDVIEQTKVCMSVCLWHVYGTSASVQIIYCAYIFVIAISALYHGTYWRNTRIYSRIKSSGEVFYFTVT